MHRYRAVDEVRAVLRRRTRRPQQFDPAAPCRRLPARPSRQAAPCPDCPQVSQANSSPDYRAGRHDMLENVSEPAIHSELARVRGHATTWDPGSQALTEPAGGARTPPEKHARREVSAVAVAPTRCACLYRQGAFSRPTPSSQALNGESDVLETDRCGRNLPDQGRITRQSSNLLGDGRRDVLDPRLRT